MELFKRRRRWFTLLAGWVFTLGAFSPSAFAMSNRTVVLRSAGSGALVGLGAGLISYPFAKSTGTILAGVAVGAILGTVYGFHLVDVRDAEYRQATLADLSALNAERDARLARRVSSSIDFAVPLTVFEF